MNNPFKKFIVNPVRSFPPLPDPLPPLPDPPQPPEPSSEVFREPLLTPQPLLKPHLWPFKIRSVRCGCYLVNFKPVGSSLVTYDGTLRVECQNNGRTASGDLYQRRIVWWAKRFSFPSMPRKPILFSGPKPSDGIPILARSRYRYYLRVTNILEGITIGNSFTLGFEMWRFTKASGPWNTGGTWSNEGTFTAAMSWQTAPPGYPSSSDYLEGDVKNSSNMVVGKLSMGWVSEYLRKATIEIDRVSQSETVLDNGSGIDWRAIGNGIGWDITVDESDSNISEPSGQFWSDAELHQTLLARRDASNLDAEWRYYVLAVRRLDSTSRGIMFDAYGGDSNNVPREGCAIASHWTIPNSAQWGTVQGVRFGAASGPYFRTAVHETGHAMGLYHNTADNGFMNTTGVIAGNSLDQGGPGFPNNVQWAYAADDQKRLRHMPDIWVRPGGIPFGASYSSTPISPTDLEVEMEDVNLNVTPLMESVPLGAPVRVNIELVNSSEEPISAPSTLNMKSGGVKGRVVDPTGTERTFVPVLRCVEHNLDDLNPGDSIRNAITLLRGAQGALFPMPGVYHILVEVHWDVEGIEAVVHGETDVMVTSAVDDAHANAALKVLSTPDVLLALVLGGDHLTEGIEAIQVALNNPVLNPHYAYIEAKRVAKRFGKRKASLSKASKLINDSTVMSTAEIVSAMKLVKSEGADSASAKGITKVLKSKLSTADMDDEIKKLMDSV